MNQNRTMRRAGENESFGSVPCLARILLLKRIIWLTLGWVFLQAALMALRAQPYTWTTIAGSAGKIGSADGTNSDARFGHFLGITVDSAENVFVADTQNSLIRKITPDGSDWVVSTIAGGGDGLITSDGTNGDAWFAGPCALALDRAENIYVADAADYAIRKITRAGTNWVVSTLAGLWHAPGTSDGTNSDARFTYPQGVAVDDAGNVFVADTHAQTIRKITPAGTNWVVTTIAGLAGTSGAADGTNSDARFNFPYNLAVDAAGTVYVADTYNATIRKIVAMGTNWVVTTIAGSAGVYGYADGLGKDARFNSPGGISADRAGNLYVAESDNATIRKIAPVETNWIVTTLGGLAGVQGSADGTGDDARFFPWGTAVDKVGNVFVADEWNYTVRRGQIAIMLQKAVAGGQLVLSWPGAASNYVLETSITLSPDASWLPLSDGVATNYDGFVLTNHMDAAAAFFRLHKQ